MHLYFDVLLIYFYYFNYFYKKKNIVSIQTLVETHSFSQTCYQVTISLLNIKKNLPYNTSDKRTFILKLLN